MYQACAAMAGATLRPVTLHPPDYAADIDEVRAADHAAHEADPAQHAAQPDRQGVRPRRAAGHRRHRHRARSHRRHRRGLRAPHVRRARAHPDRRRCPACASARSRSRPAARRSTPLAGRWAGSSGPAALVAAVRTAKQYLTYVNSGPFQPAIAVGLRLPDAFFTEIAADLQAKRDRLCAGLGRGRLRRLPTRRARTSSPSTSAPLRADGDGYAFCRELPQRCGVVAIPNEVFYTDRRRGRHLVRFAFSKRLDVLDEAVVAAEGARLVSNARRIGAHRRDPARHRVGRSRRQLRTPRADDPRGRRLGRAARAADGDVQHRLRDGPTDRRARGRAVVAVPRRAGAQPTASGSAARVRRSRPTPATTSAPSTASCSPGPTATVHRYRKIHPFTYGGEDKHFRAGDELITDRHRGSAGQPARLLRPALRRRVLAARPSRPTSTSCRPTGPRRVGCTGRRCCRRGRSRTRPTSIGCNRVGEGGGLTYSGDSRIIDPLGELLATAARTEIDPARRHQRRARRRRPATASASCADRRS